MYAPGVVKRPPGTNTTAAPTIAAKAITSALRRQKVSLRLIRRRSTIASASSDMASLLQRNEAGFYPAIASLARLSKPTLNKVILQQPMPLGIAQGHRI